MRIRKTRSRTSRRMSKNIKLQKQEYMIYYISSKKSKVSTFRTEKCSAGHGLQFWRVAKLSMLRTLLTSEVEAHRSERLPNLVCLELIGNRTEEAYATNYQKQPSVAVFFWPVIIQRLRSAIIAMSFQFLPVGLSHRNQFPILLGEIEHLEGIQLTCVANK